MGKPETMKDRDRLVTDLAAATQRAEEAEDESAGLAGVVLDLAAAVERLLPIAEVRLRETEEYIPAEEVADDEATIRAGKAALELARELPTRERTETITQKYREAVKVIRLLLPLVESAYYIAPSKSEDAINAAHYVLAKAQEPHD